MSSPTIGVSITTRAVGYGRTALTFTVPSGESFTLEARLTEPTDRQRAARKVSAKWPGITQKKILPELERLASQAVTTGTGADLGITRRLADAIRAQHHFAQDASGAIYVFDGGRYRDGGAQRIVQQKTIDLLDSWHESRRWTPELPAAVATYIGVGAPELWETPPCDRINVANGIIDLGTGQLLPHTPEWLSPIQIPIAFDPGAACPFWDNFSRQVLPEDATEFGFEMFADLLTADRSAQVAILLIGSGANGKSVLLNAIETAIGRDNVATLSLQRLESDRFSVARLVGKLANINRDLPGTDLKGTATFKQIVGGDPLTGERKFKDSFDFRPFARLIFSANHAPRSPDASEGFFRRWIVCPFPNIFEGDSASSSQELHRRLTSPAELSGLLNKALAILPRLREHGFTVAPSMQQALAEFRSLTDPVSSFLDVHTLKGPQLQVPKQALHEAYGAKATAAGWAAITSNSFGRAVRKLRPTVTDGQRTVGGIEKVHCWLGIGLKDIPEERDSRDSQVSMW